jgi:hypothetical protein
MGTKYRCDNDGCGVEKTSTTELAIFGTCRECGTGTLRRTMTSIGETRYKCTVCLTGYDEMPHECDFHAAIQRLAAKLEEARGCVRMLLTCAVPNAKEHPMMWDAHGDAAVWLGEDRNRYRIPHVALRGNARALSVETLRRRTEER